MSEVRVSIDELVGEIVLAVERYTEAVSEAVEREVHETAQAVLQEVATSSAWVDKSGKYRKGWTPKKERGEGWIRITIYNRLKPGLVHLLEKGHAKRSGGRVAARPHLVPAYDAHVPAMEARIKEIVRKGG